ncbi:MAG: hypothetical protein II852_08180 [Bacteroidales bacterium]|nr:hypothetical protein [Bacteroidales bacterium]
MQATVFNPVQLYLLQLFSQMNSEQELMEVKQVLSEYYLKKVEQKAAKIYAEKGWTPEKLEAMSNAHFRTPYK